MKTARADTPTGGLGATVNIVTAKPLQKPGQRFSVMAKRYSRHVSRRR